MSTTPRQRRSIRAPMAAARLTTTGCCWKTQRSTYQTLARWARFCASSAPAPPRRGAGGQRHWTISPTSPSSPRPATGQVLTFDGIVWSAADIPTGTTALSDLTDVSVLASPVPTTGAVLTWTGSSWDAEVHSAATLAGLDDVALTGPANGQGLFYNSATSKWNNLNAFDPPVRTLSSTSGTVTVDLSGSAYTKVTFIGNTVISGFTWPSGASGQFLHRMLSIQNSGAYTVSWPTIKWAGGAVPTVTPNGTDMFVLHTIDGGTTVYGNVIGQNYS